MKTIKLEDYDLELILEWAEVVESHINEDTKIEDDEGLSQKFAEYVLNRTKELKQKLEKIYYADDNDTGADGEAFRSHA